LEERTAASSAAQDQSTEVPRTEHRTESQRLRAFLKPPNLPQIELFEFTDSNFGEEVVSSPVPVIIDFWSDTCGPCKLMHPVVRRLAEAFGSRAKVGRLNVFTSPRTTEALEIKAIPYIMVVDRGDVVFELVGDRSFDDLYAKLLPFIP
jgi:thioredoxin 1